MLEVHWKCSEEVENGVEVLTHYGTYEQRQFHLTGWGGIANSYTGTWVSSNVLGIAVIKGARQGYNYKLISTSWKCLYDTGGRPVFE